MASEEAIARMLLGPEPGFVPTIALAEPPIPTQFAAGTWPARTWTAAEVANAVEMNAIRDQLNELHDTQTNVVIGTMPTIIGKGNGVTYETVNQTLCYLQMPLGLSPYATIQVDLELAYSVYNVQIPYVVVMAHTAALGFTVCEPTRFIGNHAGHVRVGIRRHPFSNSYVVVNSVGGGIIGAVGSQYSTAGQIPDWTGGWNVYIAHGGVPAGGNYMHWKYTITRFPGGA